MIVQSHVANPEYLNWRVEEWIESLEEMLQSFSPTEFEQHKKSLVQKKRQSYKRLLSEATDHWLEIVTHSYRFDRRFEEAKVAESLSIEDVLEFYNTYIRRNAPKRRKLSTWLLAQGFKGEDKSLEGYKEEWKHIEDLSLFKAVHKLYPCNEDNYPKL